MKKEVIYLSTIDERASQLARQYGLGIEIAEFCTAWNMDREFAGTDAIVREQTNGIQRKVLHAPFNELFPCAIDPKARDLARERYRQAIALAGRYGADKVVIHGGYNPWLYFPVWYKEQSVIFWKEFLQKDPGVEIVLENVLEEEPSMLTDIVKAVDSPRLRICLDVGHANAYSKTPVMDWLEQCGPWLSHVHLHNNDGTWDTHSPLDQGNIPVKEFLAELGRLCPEATVTLELTDTASSLRWLLEGK